MLDLQRVDLRSLAEALEDHSPETSWWFNPKTGDTEPRVDPSSADEAGQEEPFDQDLLRIESIPSQAAGVVRVP